MPNRPHAPSTTTGDKFRRDLFEALAAQKFGHGRRETFKRDGAGMYVNHDVFRAWVWFLVGLDAAASLAGRREPDISL